MNTELDDRALLELLPWYLNGTLEGAELAAVEALLLRSAEAREELEVLRRLAAAVREQEQAHEAPPFELGWARLQRSLQQEVRPAPRRRWRRSARAPQNRSGVAGLPQPPR